ncbi:MAG: YraN family protein [Jatrophihabitans sp.]|uniref:YraN family protein n=1 Tax=Jatrophihabitans sp. TaxID=1932789 RepID=UPI00390F79BD
MRVKDAVGRYGEQVAADHLETAGLVILERNWRCREGELDIVARDGAELVFVEVKTRSSLAFGSPAEAVGPVKSARIRQLALRYLLTRREAGDDSSWAALRFDVVAVVRSAGTGPEVVHVRGAF